MQHAHLRRKWLYMRAGHASTPMYTKCSDIRQFEGQVHSKRSSLTRPAPRRTYEQVPEAVVGVREDWHAPSHPAKSSVMTDPFLDQLTAHQPEPFPWF
jgi:hypothetical protein